jgi:hypothetical protein
VRVNFVQNKLIKTRVKAHAGEKKRERERERERETCSTQKKMC